jgi:hypothetical protein
MASSARIIRPRQKPPLFLHISEKQQNINFSQQIVLAKAVIWSHLALKLFTAKIYNSKIYPKLIAPQMDKSNQYSIHHEQLK